MISGVITNAILQDLTPKFPLRRKKKSVVFVNKEKTFKNVGDVTQLEGLVECMSDHARLKADEKIRLFEQIESLKHEQTQMFA